MTDTSNRAGNSESMLDADLGEVDDQLDAAPEDRTIGEESGRSKFLSDDSLAKTKTVLDADAQKAAAETRGAATSTTAIETWHKGTGILCTSDLKDSSSWILNTTLDNMCIRANKNKGGDEVAAICIDKSNKTDLSGLDYLYKEDGRPKKCGEMQGEKGKGAKFVGLVTENGMSEDNVSSYYMPYCYVLPKHETGKKVEWKHMDPEGGGVTTSSVTISYLKLSVCKTILSSNGRYCSRTTKCSVRKKIYSCKVTDGHHEGSNCDDDKIGQPSYITYPAMSI